MIELPQDDRALRRNERVMARVVKRPYLHVAAVGRIWDVHRIVKKNTCVIPLHQLLAHPREPVAPRRRQLRERPPGCRPFADRLLVRADRKHIQRSGLLSVRAIGNRRRSDFGGRIRCARRRGNLGG